MSVETAKRLKVLFLSECCVLDPNSGAAISMLNWLHVLKARGHSCYSVTMSLFDGQAEFPLRREIFPDLDVQASVGQRIRTVVQGIEHNIYNVGTSIGPKVPVDRVEGFMAAAAEDIRRIRPDVVIGYGTPNLVPLRRLAADQGARTIFYLANASYGEDRKAALDAVDTFVVGSNAIGEYYRRLHGIDAWTVIPSRVRDYFRRPDLSREFLLARKRQGFVTMVNPSVAKGVGVFLQIANYTKPRFPNLTFLAVESRVTRQEIEAEITNVNLLDNIWWVQRQRNMRSVYQRSALILVPSLTFEASSRVIAEAQRAGIPVLATDVGGNSEQLNGGGFLFPRPELGSDLRRLPGAGDVMPWVDKIAHLLGGDDKHYLAACRKGLEAGSRHDQASVDRAIFQLVEQAPTRIAA
ncbi:MAG: glycosyltransferase family 4 protein [Alphaproteobacteria bacterium]|nr:glycosyltransferase family 4 protein [Alphaproteobacteria bacterium]